MTRRINLWWVLAGILCVRLLSMWLFPLIDTSEPRYAEIARLMAQSGDWITPWFKPGVPFWGKPPLAFWAQALSIDLLGLSAFASRLPSWLATAATAALLIAYARSHYGPAIGKWTGIIYCSCVLVYITSGAVLTDPFLVLGTTLSMVSLPMAERHPKWYWRYGFFIGLSVGLLAKGPLALVLVAGPLIPWLWWHKPARKVLRALPWVPGVILTLIISVPWYIVADIKTPGFLDYFIVGEHFRRFVDSGWKGDMYGTAHAHARGTIWLYLLMASLPWSLLAGWILGRAALNGSRRASLRQALRQPHLTYLLAWILFTPLFFTLAGNILWTYVLPSLGAFSILLAVALDGWRAEQPLPFVAPATGALIGVIPALSIVLTVAALAVPQRVKTERGLVHYAQHHMQAGEHLVYVHKRPFSARFYSRETAGVVADDKLATALSATGPTYLAIPKDRFLIVSKQLDAPIHKLYENDRYILVAVSPRPKTGTKLASSQKPIQDASSP